MRSALPSALLSALLCLSLTGACAKQPQPQTPAPPAAAEPAPPPAPAEEALVVSGDPAPAPVGDPGPRPASLSDEDIAIADQVVAGIEKMTNAIATAGADCPKVAAAIKAMSGDMAAIAERGKKLDAKMASDEPAKKWFEATYAPKVMSLMGKVMNNACFEDKAVQEAMSAIEM